MFYGDSIQDTRQLFFSSWKKYEQNLPLSALEKQLVTVIIDHPEYQALFKSIISKGNQIYFPEFGQTNPFLHMGLHLVIRDQITTDKPEGITAIYKQLLNKYNDKLLVEHLLIDPLAECLWEAQHNQYMFNIKNYLIACNKLLKN